MINCSFAFNLNFLSKSPWPKKGWGSTHIEVGSRFGWNFFTRIRHWNKDTTELLPPVTKLRFRTVEYYHEVEEKIWDFMERKYNHYPKYDDIARDYDGPTVRLKLVIYRLPLITITNSYHTELDRQRHLEFKKELEKEIDNRGQSC